MLGLEYRTLHNLVFIEPVRIGYASSEEEARDLARSNAGGRAIYDRRDRATDEDNTAHCATLDTRGKITGCTSWGAVSGQTGRACGLSKGTLARRQKNSASSEVCEAVRTDAARDASWDKFTRLCQRQQRLWTVRPSETPGLPFWAVGSGSGSAPLPFETWCILRPLTSVSGCLSARPTGYSSVITGTSTVQAPPVGPSPGVSEARRYSLLRAPGRGSRPQTAHLDGSLERAGWLRSDRAD